MTTISYLNSIESKPNGTITDHKYSPTGEHLAVADSQGYIQIYTRKDKAYAKVNQFRADQGSVWSISWADSKYGNVLGVGTLRSKVLIFQENGNVWREIAYHDLHQASVNWVEFSSIGLKLYAGSSDGYVSVLELSQKNWKSFVFQISDLSVACLAIQPLPLGESVSQENAQKIYPRFATVTKDQKIKIWAHESEKYHSEAPQKKIQTSKQNGYYLLKQLATPNLTVRNLLWRPSWGSFSEAFSNISLIACSVEGIVKQFNFNFEENDEDSSLIILQGENQIVRVSQSLTGNLLTVSTVNKTENETYVYEECEPNQWQLVSHDPL